MKSILCALLSTLAVISVVKAQTTFAVYTATMTVPNYVAVFQGNSSGSLSFVSHVATGQNGIPADAGGAGSQHAIYVKGNYLFVVNPSSNSLSLFSINPSNPTSITLINSLSTNYDWPNTVTVHPTQNVACVATSGQNNGIRCFTYSATGLTVLVGTDQPLGLNLTTPPAFHTGPAQISFTPDGSGLAVSIKTSDIPVMYFPFTQNQVASTPVAAPPKGNVPFGFAFDTDGTMVLTDAAPTGTYSGVELLSLSSSAVTFLLPNYTLIPYQHASCWAERGPNGNFYIVNAASANITEISRSGDDITVLGEYGTGVAGSTDIAFAQISSHSYAYVQNNAVIVAFDVTTAGGGFRIQTVNQSSLGQYSAGVATYVPVSSPSPSPSPSSSPSTAPTSTPSPTNKASSSTTSANKITSSASFVVPSFFVLVGFIMVQYL